MPVVCLIVAALTPSPCSGKATREQIIALAQRCKNEEKRLDLVAAFGVDFSGLDLSGVDLRGHHAAGYETCLGGANLSNCNLQRTDFGAAVLDGADFTGANLEGATFVTASLKQAILLRVRFKGTRFYQSDLSRAKLAHADLSSAEITGSHFPGADLSDAVLSGARNDWWSDFASANLTGARLAGLQLNGASFRGAILRSANLAGTGLVQADFTGADLTESSLVGARVESAVFRDVKGLSPAQKEQLEGQAQRWKFELKAHLTALLEWMYVPGYLLVLVALAALSFRVLRSPDSRRIVVVATVVNLTSLVPPGVLLAITALGTSPTAQMNANSLGAMRLWSRWVDLWPCFMLALLCCLAVAIATGLIFTATHWRPSALMRATPQLAYVCLTVAHCLLAMSCVLANSPRA
jgi:uncharacterized protein YjbI with pentapeptide repeats